MEIPENLNVRSKNEPPSHSPQHVLIGILDWGLGHATRCIPIIRYMHQFQCQIFIATSAPQRALLEKEIPGLIFLDPPSYDIRYPKEGKWLLAKLFSQILRLLRVIWRENRWLASIIENHHITYVISDNRYGLHHRRIKSFFICHQLSPTVGFWSFPDNIIRNIHYRYINKFTACWIPDVPESPGLSGKLGHPGVLPANVEYIGPLSRMIKSNVADENLILVLLSGPEPQRTLLENILLSQLSSFAGKFLLVRGRPEEECSSHPFIVNHLESGALNEAMNRSKLVICRAGYSSIMDLVRLQKKAILIPTPGQTEQEYLADEMERRGIFQKCRQKDFNLETVLQKAESFPFRIPEMDFNRFESVIMRSLSLHETGRK